MAVPRALITSLSLALLLVASPLCCMAKNILYSGEILNSGQALTYEKYKLIPQKDCDLVLYSDDQAIWSSGTAGKGSDCYLTQQSDGNLVIYNNNNQPVWASNTDKGDGNYVCILQEDRNVVVYGGALWATNTNKKTGVLGDMFIESKATIFGVLPANETAAAKAETKAAGISKLLHK